jgi:hypothetical protein
MIRNLAQCPYCSSCEIALDDTPAVAFNPGGSPQPCSHFAWVDGRYSQWDRSPQGVDHVIGSTEFSWDPPQEALERTDDLLAYLRELVSQGPSWPFAPPVPFSLRQLSAEEKSQDGKGKSHTVWDIDGWAIFTKDPAAFWAAVPGCRQRQLEGLQVDEG